MSRSPSLREAFDPEFFRKAGRQLVDRLADYLAAAHDRRLPATTRWLEPEVQLKVTPAFQEAPTATLDEVAGELLEFARHTQDPRCMGHQDSVPLPAAAVTELLVSLINNDPSVYETAPRHVAIEQRVLRWMADEMGQGPEASGVLTSGGSLGNLTALLAARQAQAAHAGFNAWTAGHGGGPSLCLLASAEIHYCVARAVQIMGWGEEGVVPVPVDADYRMRVEALPAALAEAKGRGRTVVGVAASAGTTSTGAYDPLPAIADFCEREGLWFHVDAAHGGSAALSPRYRHLLEGVERADSIVWDAHKMMMMPPPLTAVLFRDGRHPYGSFRQEASYLLEGRPNEEWYNPANRTVECTRSAMATRLYAALRVHGAGVFRDYVTHCFDMARRLAELVEEAPDFELAVVPQANMVCFRYLPPEGGDLDALQAALCHRMVRDGLFYLTDAHLGPRTWLRTTIMHPATDDAQLLKLLDAIRRTAAAGD
jgi:L-2,4-diaminobutyrate decarboxylase